MTGRRPPRAHGTRARYTFGPAGSDRSNGCRCIPCTDANRDYQRARARGEHRMVRATDARRHLTWLADQGIGLRAVADTTGLDRHQLVKIRSGRTTTIRDTTHDRILAVHRLRGARPGQRVDPEPTRRLIDDLLAHGWTKARLARALGYRGKELAFLRSTRIRRWRADQVAAFHAHALRQELAQLDASTPRKAA